MKVKIITLSIVLFVALSAMSVSAFAHGCHRYYRGYSSYVVTRPYPVYYRPYRRVVVYRSYYPAYYTRVVRRPVYYPYYYRPYRRHRVVVNLRF
ncbi:MAG TPA: hypothetical protein VFC63_02355 [Blastocatellia bacterium]|nr:hypothetical protein [Blastocatellia bacterium]